MGGWSVELDDTPSPDAPPTVVDRLDGDGVHAELIGGHNGVVVTFDNGIVVVVRPNIFTPSRVTVVETFGVPHKRGTNEDEPKDKMDRGTRFTYSSFVKDSE